MRQPPPSTAFRDPTGSSTEGPSRTARMRQPPPSTALRGPIRGLLRRSQRQGPHALATTQQS
eukprot:3255165-Pyramimonas_sp.AAC.1